MQLFLLKPSELSLLTSISIISAYPLSASCSPHFIMSISHFLTFHNSPVVQRPTPQTLLAGGWQHPGGRQFKDIDMKCKLISLFYMYNNYTYNFMSASSNPNNLCKINHFSNDLLLINSNNSFRDEMASFIHNSHGGC